MVVTRPPKNGESSSSSSPSPNPFPKGAKVEVAFEEDGLRGSWYSATVIRPLPKKKDSRKLFLEFDNLTESSGKPLREYVDYILARPIPPRENRRRFRVMEEVDAFHNDGWWEGIVITVLEDRRYSVFFRCSREQIDFAESQLRLHREWVKEDWVPPLEEDAED